MFVSEVITEVFFCDPAPDDVLACLGVEEGVGGVEASVIEVAAEAVLHLHWAGSW